MATTNSFEKNAKKYFEKLMRRKFIEKRDLLSLKSKFKELKDSGNCPNFFNEGNNMLNKITRIANNAKGKNSIEIVQKAYEDFTKLST
ncbi:MAG: hypothetical protein WC606_00425 [Candidatus Absconditabacterales bacterium]|jgi:hypothetical protein